MAELTANEKAATFIGWRPNTPIWKEGMHESYKEMMSFPPNMSDPRNYMKALERLEEKHDISIRRITADSCQWDCDIDEIASAWFNDLGNAVVAALAALYDKENANG